MHLLVDCSRLHAIFRKKPSNRGKKKIIETVNRKSSHENINRKKKTKFHSLIALNGYIKFLLYSSPISGSSMQRMVNFKETGFPADFSANGTTFSRALGKVGKRSDDR